MKRIEYWAKLLLALLASLLLYRPRRASWTLDSPKRILLVRIDDRVGEALLMTPLATALKNRFEQCEVHLLVHGSTARVLEGHPHIAQVFPFDRTRLFLGPLAPGIQA